MVNRRWVSWNMRGLGGAEKRRAVREAIKSFNPDITLLHETKLDANKAKVIQDFSLSLNLAFDFIPARDVAGGLLTMWKPA